MKKYAVFLLIIVCIIFSACTAQPQTIYLSPKQVAEILSKATCETTSNQEGRIFISAIFQTDEDYQTQLPSLLQHFLDTYPDYLAYGSRGLDPRNYQNRYNGYLTWIDNNGSILQLSLTRDEQSKAAVEILFVPKTIHTKEGIIDKIDEFTLHMIDSDTQEELYIYWDYPGIYMYPYLIEGAEVGKSIRIFYMDEVTSFGEARGNRSCLVKALTILN